MRGIIAFVFVPWLGVLAVCLYLQPISGDLTRVGSFPEKHFGWNEPQVRFTRYLSDAGGYDRYYDVVVSGDSFSAMRMWQDHLAAATGLSVVTLLKYETPLDRVLESRAFKEAPPRLFIVENVERTFTELVEEMPPCGRQISSARSTRVSSRPAIAIPGASEDIEALTVYIDRDTFWGELKPQHLFRYIRYELGRKLASHRQRNALRIELSRDAPFTSAVRDAMLVYKDDVNKAASWRDMGVEEMACRIERLRERIEANGVTRFVLMVVPDKLTAYSDFVRDPALQRLSRLPELASYAEPFMPRVDIALVSAINRGVKDVYLPNDSHWGSAGYRIAAEALVRYLQH